MKKISFIIGITVVALVACSKLGVLQALLLFFLVGAIPGTDLTVPSSVMFFSILIAAWVVVFRFTALKALEMRAVARLAKAYNERKNNQPKRRFRQV
jgi:hypothetical protein